MMRRVNAPVHNANKLLSHILRTSHASCLNEVFVTPRVRKFARLPAIIDREESQVVPFWLMELCFLRVGLRLLLLRSVKDILHRQHCSNR
jgi:riboflavin transporter FmnP